MEVARASEASSFGKYTLVAKLATGGMAEIFLARLLSDGGFEKLVCIKRILPHLAKDPQFVAMFLDEARVVARISHPNVCQVFELGEIAGQYYIAMEYLAGVPLAIFRRRDYYAFPPEIQLVAGLGLQACEGLHHAHQLKAPTGELLGVVHRDISPQNLYITNDGIVKVLDFGIAKVQDQSAKTSTGTLKGTYCYMAPEQLRGEKIDRRADVWALGAVLWESLAQRHLFKRETEFLTFQAITAEPIPHICELRPDVPPLAGDTIARALSRDRDERFATARAFGEALAQAVAPLGGVRTAAQIADLIETSFHSVLAEQVQLLERARVGDNFDLEKSNPLGGPHASTSPTPVSNIKGKLAAAQAEVAQYVRAQEAIRSIPEDERSASGFTPPPGWRAHSSEMEAVDGDGSGVTIVPAGKIVPRDPTRPRASRVMPDEESPVPSLRGPSKLPWLVAIAVVTAAAIVTTWMVATKPVARGDVTQIDMPVTRPTPPPPPQIKPPVADPQPAVVPPADAQIPVADAAPEHVVDKPAPPRHPKPSHEVAVAEKPASGPPGHITIDSAPVYATIYIDGKNYGETPLVNISVPPGHHVVKAVSPSGSTRSSTISIESGKTSPVHRIEW
ncbi:MAG TPA: serine/threonine-protein kinase [Kofleriaceae bacterium]|jgi:serine/threonine-protein kinase